MRYRNTNKSRTVFLAFIKSVSLFFLLIISSKAQAQDQELPIVFSTYYGDVGTDDADVVAVDLFGNTYLGCHSNSPGLLKDGKNTYTLKGGMDAFVIKLNKEGSRIVYLANLGGSDWDAVQGLVSDTLGNIYAIGTTYSPNFPVSENAFQQNFGGESDAFLVKLDPNGKVVWSTFIGGSKDEDGRGITIDAIGNIHVIGRTESSDFPVSANALQPGSAGGIDAFVSTFNSNGEMLTTTYLGGSGNDIGFAIDHDSKGRLYIAGTTNSTNFPVRNAIQVQNNGGDDLFFAVINSNRTGLEISSYWGGVGSDKNYSIDVGPSGDIYIMGVTNSSDLPTTESAFQEKSPGGRNAFVSRLDIENKDIIYSTYLGGGMDENPRNLVVDQDGNAYVVGNTTSDDFPTSTSLQGENDAFITVLNAEGSGIIYSTLFGGNGREIFEGIAMGSDNTITVSGLTNSADFPLKKPLQSKFLGGRFDIAVARFNFSNFKYAH